MARTGRPKTKIDKESFEKLCMMHCTLIEIAGFFNCSEDTIENWCKENYKATFSDVYKRKSARGNISLRRSQFQSAEAGNVTMQIWLGKQWLGQKEQQEIDLSFNSEDTVREMESYFDRMKTESME